uniref:Interleukin 20 receptor, alpha n=1 Tax=Sphaeramia orbicularis TaxID=375764 RepID=A0A673BZM0_9TELE
MCQMVWAKLKHPINVTFSSVNLRNVLQWSPGNGTPPEAHYTVQYAIYGDSVLGSKGKRLHWRSVRLCTEIVRNWCDLTNETWDLEEGYYAKVRAVGRKGTSKWALTQSRFDPKTGTDLGPPLVSVEIENMTAIITMRGPMRYVPNNQTPAVPMATIYPQMIYNLSVLNTYSDQIRHFSVVSHKYTYHLLDYSTEYCFSARARFLAMPTHCLSSAWHCITTPEDPVITQLKRIVVGIVVPSVCICFLVVGGYVLYHYLTGKDQKNPYFLLPLDTKEHKSDPASIRQVPHDPDLPPSYARQHPETPPPPEEPWDDLSVAYGCVGVNPQVNFGGEGENMELSSEGGEVLLNHTHESVRPFQGANSGAVDKEREERPGLFLNKNPQTGLFDLALNLLSSNEEGMEEEVNRKVMGRRTDGSESEKVALLSAYASQNIRAMPAPRCNQLELLPYDVLRSAEMQEMEGEGALTVKWDPESRRIVFPEVDFREETGLDQLESKTEMLRREGEEEVNRELRLENVFIRQESGEEAGGQVAKETGEEGDILTKWNLVISMD